MLGKFDYLIDIGSEETFCVEDVRHILEEIMNGES